MMKTFYNNKILHDTFKIKNITEENTQNNNNSFIECTDVRFTKVLTKYSTEYNNILFIYNLCQELNMDKKDLIAFFQELRLFFGKEFYQSPEILNKVELMFENYNIN